MYPTFWRQCCWRILIPSDSPVFFLLGLYPEFLWSTQERIEMYRQKLLCGIVASYALLDLGNIFLRRNMLK